MYVMRKDGVIVAGFFIESEGATEWLPEESPEWQAFLKPSPPPIDLAAYAAQKRWEREVGGIQFSGLTVATDDRSKIMISGARIKADKDPAFVTSWKGPDGQFLTLDAETIISVSDAVLDHVNDCFALEASVLVQIAEGGIVDVDGVDAAFNA